MYMVMGIWEHSDMYNDFIKQYQYQIVCSDLHSNNAALLQ